MERTNDHPSTVRVIAVPLTITAIAVVFWLSYYGQIRWWPAVLLAIFLVNYAAYSVRKRHRLDIFTDKGVE